jgi:mono/diheme cytochrome c family protein
LNARSLFSALSFAVALPVVAAESRPARISFNNQIQPLLSENCYPCHGPDSATRKPKKQPLRLDREQFAFEPRENGKPVIIKGNPAASEVVRRLKATDDDVMPPASQHKIIKPEDIALIERWIAEGAKFDGPDRKAALATIESRTAAALSWLAISGVMPNIRLETGEADPRLRIGRIPLGINQLLLGSLNRRLALANFGKKGLGVEQFDQSFDR